jgi:hypothetical protein
MKNYSGVTACWLALLLAPASALAGPQDPWDADPGTPTVIAADGAEDYAQTDDRDAAGPWAQAPDPALAPPPPQYDQAPQYQQQPQAPAGQWVDTQQYGRVWMPYADAYTYTPPSGYGEPQAYVYYPSYGWTWVVAPWIWGFGPWPTFGVYGAAHFGWYGHGWWRTPSRWHYAPSYRAGGYPPSHGGYGPGTRPPPYRSSPGVRGVGAPGYRGMGQASWGSAPRGVGAPGWSGGNHAAGAPGGSGAYRGGGSPGRNGGGHGGEARGAGGRASGGHGGGHRR